MPVTRNTAPRLNDGDRRKGTSKLALPRGESDVDAIRSFMVDCLVPILAAEFLRQRDDSTRLRVETMTKNPTSEHLGRKVGC
jgi:hypothetical protein